MSFWIPFLPTNKRVGKRKIGKTWSIRRRQGQWSLVRRLLWIGLAIAGACVPLAVLAQESAFDWRADWAVAQGFSLAIDTIGYHLPSAIVFVPNPGPKPDDPLYFVAEVRGTIKVVSNDRTVRTFAEGFMEIHPQEELPSGKGQVGLAGLCLAPAQGYLFATFAYQDQAGVLRNNMIRFTTKPNTFALKPTAQQTFTEIFLPYESGLAHHIGPCQVSDDGLFVSVGEAWQPHLAQDLTTMHGKLLHMTLDGEPLADNPFYVDNDRQKATNYIWAYGLRNPFGLKLVGDRLFTADNGQNIDRFIELHRGENYLWNGSDKTIAANAAFVFVPSIAPVQLDRYPTAATFFPDTYADAFFLAAAASEAETQKIPGIFTFQYDLATNKMLRLPEYFVKYRGEGYQATTGLAFGPDGLYFTNVMPNAAGETPVFKVAHAPEAGYPYSTKQVTDPAALFVEKGCAGCHAVGAKWGFGSNVGPNLDPTALTERLLTRLQQQSYLSVLDEMDKITADPQQQWRQARQEVRTATDLVQVRTWVKYHIMEPRFDTLYSAMPTLGVTADEATMLAAFLVNDPQAQAFSLRGLLPQRLRAWHLIVAFGAGVVATIIGTIVLWVVAGRWPRRAGAPARSGAVTG